MTGYTAPLEDMRFVLRELVDLDARLARAAHAELSSDVVDAVLEAASRFAAEVLAPTDASADAYGTAWVDGSVRTAPGCREAYRQFVEAGWHALPGPVSHGGQGFPRVLSGLVDEMWRSSSLALTGCVALTRGAVEALFRRASPELQQRYLPALVRGDWTGCMNLTEPQAGSDVSAIRTRAEPAADGSYRIFGQKIFITFGEHDLADNIVHLVLARTPGAPAGVKGISMFLVPKLLSDAGGSLVIRNDVQCLAIEKKVGQHGSPTTVLAYGERETPVPGHEGQGAVGYLVGELHEGLQIMFVMMNEARFAVGLEGLAISERAYQTALHYARTRIQGTAAGGEPGSKDPIIRHPDVRRMLMQMKAGVEAMRALTVLLAAALDDAEAADAPAERHAARAFLELMTPVYKGWNTELAQQLTSLGVQIHGGFGFMQECPASRHWRDARILPIYEGTTGIQASDLVVRKLARDSGGVALATIARMKEDLRQLTASDSTEVRRIAQRTTEATDALREAVLFVVQAFDAAPREALSVSVPLLRMFGITAGGWQMARAAGAACRLGRSDPDNSTFRRSKIDTAAFFSAHYLPEVEALRRQVLSGGASVMALAESEF